MVLEVGPPARARRRVDSPGRKLSLVIFGMDVTIRGHLEMRPRAISFSFVDRR